MHARARRGRELDSPIDWSHQTHLLLDQSLQFERKVSQILTHPGDLLDITYEKRQKWLMADVPEEEPEYGTERKNDDVGTWKDESDAHKAWAVAHGGDYLRLVDETKDMTRGTPDAPADFNRVIITKKVTNGNDVNGIHNRPVKRSARILQLLHLFSACPPLFPIERKGMRVYEVSKAQ